MTSLLLGALAAAYLASCGWPPISPRETILLTLGSSLRSLESRPWTALTSVFLHANLAHLALNEYALYVLGRGIEPPLGGGRTAILFLTAGTVGSISSALINPLAIGIGASAGILGMFGWLVTQEYRSTGRISPATALAAVLVISGGFMAGVDVAAHAAGFACGVALGFLWAPRLPRGRRWSSGVGFG